MEQFPRFETQEEDPSGDQALELVKQSPEAVGFLKKHNIDLSSKAAKKAALSIVAFGSMLLTACGAESQMIQPRIELVPKTQHIHERLEKEVHHLRAVVSKLEQEVEQIKHNASEHSVNQTSVSNQREASRSPEVSSNSHASGHPERSANPSRSSNPEISGHPQSSMSPERSANVSVNPEKSSSPSTSLTPSSSPFPQRK